MDFSVYIEFFIKLKYILLILFMDWNVVIIIIFVIFLNMCNWWLIEIFINCYYYNL